MNNPLLKVDDLSVAFIGTAGILKAVSEVSFTLQRSEILGIVGESGSGKSITCLSILKLLPHPGQIISGEIRFDGEDIISKTPREMRAIRGKRISMILQDPMTSLNPVFTIGNQVSEPLRIHNNLRKTPAREIAIELLKLVGIPSPSIRYKQYPHQFSGGMRQRTAIAMAIACSPDLLIADEPTTALDVTIQSQILQELLKIRDKKGTAIILVTHDLGVVAQSCDRVIVMYGGMSMETGTVTSIFHQPKHPYTQSLLRAIPTLRVNNEGLYSIPGQPPSLSDLPPGCPFWPRCELAIPICKKTTPPMFSVSNDHEARCWLLSENTQDV